MFVKFYYRAGVAFGMALLSGCAIVSNDTQISPTGALQNDLISRSGSSEGPNDALGNSFTSVINWAQIGGGEAKLDGSVLTLRHAPGLTSPSGGTSRELNIFSPTDTFSVEGGRDGTNFSLQGFTVNSILGRFEETQGSGASARGYAAYSTAGFQTSFADIVTLGRAGGTAVYRGTSFAEVFDGQGRSDTAAGIASVNVDFGANNISGALVFRDVIGDTAGPDLGNFSFGITDGSLAGNTFSAKMTANFSDVGATTLNEFDVNGSLYGPLGVDIGGDFATTGTAAGSGEDLVLIGGFLATQ